MAPYTGGWLANALYKNVQPAVHTSDPAHSNTTGTDENAFVYAAPAGIEVGVGMGDYPGQEYVIQTGGSVVDTTSSHDHTDGYAGGIYSDLQAMQAATGAAHSHDQGASHERNRAVAPLQSSTEHYGVIHSEEHFNTTVDPVALQRGLNGLPVNNPNGFRAGVNITPFIDRKFMIGERFHDAHAAEVNVAAIIKDQPVPRTAHQYNSPFSLLARAMTRSPVPMVRRDPISIDDSIVTDGTDTTHPDLPTWVVG